MPANLVHLFLMIRACSDLIRPGTRLVYPWKEDPAGFYRLNVHDREIVTTGGSKRSKSQIAPSLPRCCNGQDVGTGAVRPEPHPPTPEF